MARAPKSEIRERDLQGFKHFRLLIPIMERLHADGCQSDIAGNRRLHFDQYAALILLYFFNPVVTSLRGIQQASELRKVQRKLGCARAALGSLSIDAGDPDHEPAEGETDLDAHSRILCDRVDMGAYEFGIGDFDCNRMVDLFDFEQWLTCFTGPDGGPYAPGCEAFDADADAHVDWSDFATIQVAFTGSP